MVYCQFSVNAALQTIWPPFKFLISSFPGKSSRRRQEVRRDASEADGHFQDPVGQRRHGGRQEVEGRRPRRRVSEVSQRWVAQVMFQRKIRLKLEFDHSQSVEKVT